MTSSFRAPWGRELIVRSTVGTLALGIPVVVQALRGLWAVPTLLIVILTVTLLHCVRGYEVGAGELRVRRLLWDTPWPLDRTTTATVRPHAMRGSWRTWGNGGLFAISGRFSGSGLGRYHAFVTNPVQTVVITTQKGIVVVSPDRPDAFVAAVTQAANRG